MKSLVRFLLVAQFCALSSLTGAFAADKALIEAAKKEGQVTWYTVQIVDQIVRPVIEAFERKYGIPVNYVRANSTEIGLRVINEAKAGRVQASVIDGVQTYITTLSTRPPWAPTVNTIAQNAYMNWNQLGKIVQLMTIQMDTWAPKVSVYNGTNARDLLSNLKTAITTHGDSVHGFPMVNTSLANLIKDRAGMVSKFIDGSCEELSTSFYIAFGVVVLLTVAMIVLMHRR